MPPLLFVGLLFFNFVFIGIEHVQDARSLGIENADQIPRRSLQHTEQHRLKHRLRGQLSKIANLGRGENLTLHITTLGGEFVILLAEIKQQFRNRAAISTAEHHRGPQRKIDGIRSVDVQKFASFLDQRVLQHVTGSIGIRQLLAEFLQLFDLEAGELDEVDIIGRTDLFTDLFDQKLLFASHSLPLANSFGLILIPGVIVAVIVQERM